jgi:ATP-dependent exoDNAse (exonuclease V) alpha subunit/5S rRNA maturation endonuclease (ribonuclease M5)
VIAKFHHDNSRALDPHLHTHCIVLNTTQLANGKWQSILNEPFLRNKMWLGAIYRNELSRRVQELGYEVEFGKDGLFEIKGYTQEQLEHFSKRRLAILQQSRNPANAIERELAWKQTRIAKGYPIPRSELRQSRLRDCQALAVQPPQAHSYSVWQVQTPAEAAVQVAVEHCAERHTVFLPKAVKQFALLSYLGQNSPDAIAAALEQNPELIQTYDGRLTTQQAVQRELDTIRLMEAGKGWVTKITSLERVEGHLRSKPLTQGQRDAITLAATTSDQFIAWLGVAGAGKTYALNQFCQMAQTQEYLVKGYAPSAEAAKILGQEIHVEANTVARLLVAQPHKTQPQQIWIIDEAGLLSAKDAHALLHKATEEQARVILVGDLRQLSAVEAGNPFKSLQQAGISTASLNESLRQKTEELRTAVDWVARGDVEAGFQKLDEQRLIVERKTDELRLKRLARDYLALEVAERSQTLVLAGTNQERALLTEQIRKGLKAEGHLEEADFLTQLRAKDLTQVQAGYAHNYAVGDVVIPVYSYKRLGLKKGERYQVETVDESKNTLTLRTADHVLEADPGQFKRKAVYTQEQVEVAVGDRLKWTRNDPVLGHRNGQEVQVVNVNTQNHTTKVLHRDGRAEVISLQYPQHLDHAWVSTVYGSQGKTANRVLVATDTTMNAENFYVAISRAKYDLKIYTEDKADLLQQVQKTRAKENPLEFIKGLKSVRQPETVRTATVEQSLASRIEASTSSVRPLQQAMDLAERGADIKHTDQPLLKPRTEIAAQVRNLPLEEVAAQLGLEPDRYDKYKWRKVSAADGSNQTLSINGQKFYDHLNQKGGGGAIDLVMHVQNWQYRDALEWLSGISSYAAPKYQQLLDRPPEHKHHQTAKRDKPPACNIKDESKWPDVKCHLVEERGLPEDSVDVLHQEGLLHADSHGNVMFFRYRIDTNFNRGEAIGANLRGTHGDFKELTPGVRRNEGYFWVQSGQGEVQRVLLTESPIDALSLAALDKWQCSTVYLSTDGAGAVPIEQLRQLVKRGGQVVLAFDADQAGVMLTQKVMAELPEATRLIPMCGKDWNEQLLAGRSLSLTVERILAFQGVEQTDGSWVFEGENYRLSRQGNVLTIIARDGRGEILKLDSGNTVSTQLSQADRKRLRQAERNQPMVVAIAVRQLLSDLRQGKVQPDGSHAFESRNYHFWQRSSIIGIMAKDGRGEILKVDTDKPILVKLSLKDLEQLKNLRALVSKRLQVKQDVQHVHCRRNSIQQINKH